MKEGEGSGFRSVPGRKGPARASQMVSSALVRIGAISHDLEFPRRAVHVAGLKSSYVLHTSRILCTRITAPLARYGWGAARLPRESCGVTPRRAFAHELAVLKDYQRCLDNRKPASVSQNLSVCRAKLDSCDRRPCKREGSVD